MKNAQVNNKKMSHSRTFDCYLVFRGFTSSKTKIVPDRTNIETVNDLATLPCNISNNMEMPWCSFKAWVYKKDPKIFSSLVCSPLENRNMCNDPMDAQPHEVVEHIGGKILPYKFYVYDAVLSNVNGRIRISSINAVYMSNYYYGSWRGHLPKIYDGTDITLDNVEIQYYIHERLKRLITSTDFYSDKNCNIVTTKLMMLAYSITPISISNLESDLKLRGAPNKLSHLALEGDELKGPKNFDIIMSDFIETQIPLYNSMNVSQTMKYFYNNIDENIKKASMWSLLSFEELISTAPPSQKELAEAYKSFSIVKKEVFSKISQNFIMYHVQNDIPTEISKIDDSMELQDIHIVVKTNYRDINSMWTNLDKISSRHSVISNVDDLASQSDYSSILKGSSILHVQGDFCSGKTAITKTIVSKLLSGGTVSKHIIICKDYQNVERMKQYIRIVAPHMKNVQVVPYSEKKLPSQDCKYDSVVVDDAENMDDIYFRKILGHVSHKHAKIVLVGNYFNRCIGKTNVVDNVFNTLYQYNSTHKRHDDKGSLSILGVEFVDLPNKLSVVETNLIECWRSAMSKDYTLPGFATEMLGLVSEYNNSKIGKMVGRKDSTEISIVEEIVNLLSYCCETVNNDVPCLDEVLNEMIPDVYAVGTIPNGLPYAYQLSKLVHERMESAGVYTKIRKIMEMSNAIVPDNDFIGTSETVEEQDGFSVGTLVKIKIPIMSNTIQPKGTRFFIKSISKNKSKIRVVMHNGCVLECCSGNLKNNLSYGYAFAPNEDPVRKRSHEKKTSMIVAQDIMQFKQVGIEFFVHKIVRSLCVSIMMPACKMKAKDFISDISELEKRPTNRMKIAMSPKENDVVGINGGVSLLIYAVFISLLSHYNPVPQWSNTQFWSYNRIALYKWLKYRTQNALSLLKQKESNEAEESIESEDEDDNVYDFDFSEDEDMSPATKKTKH